MRSTTAILSLPFSKSLPAALIPPFYTNVAETAAERD